MMNDFSKPASPKAESAVVTDEEWAELLKKYHEKKEGGAMPNLAGYTPPPPKPILAKLASDSPYYFQMKRDGSAKLKGQVQDLLNMLSYMRPAGTATESLFIRKFLVPLDCKQDSHGNIWKRIGEANGEASPILWSSHTDTVHRSEGKQKLKVKKGIVQSLSGECLGADDTTGVWIMRQMIMAGVPGTYCFHREEEVGGHGSRFVAENLEPLLEEHKFAIAFDRRGYDSVITHQWGRCASDAFARSVGEIIGMGYCEDSTGTFTDTANYEHIIPECSNLSVGYGNAHQSTEWQDIPHAIDLLYSIINGDWTKLVCDRDPHAVTLESKYYGGTNQTPTRVSGGIYSGPASAEQGYCSRINTDKKGLEWYCAQNPDRVAQFLADNGFSIADIEDGTYAK